MTNWPVAGGTVRDDPTERNLRDIRRRGGETERRLSEAEARLATGLGSHYSYPNFGNNAELTVTENRVYYAQVQVLGNSTLTGIGYFPTGKAGNVRSALYDASGARVANRSTNQEVLAGAYQKVAFTATYIATPGVYFVALVFSSSLAKAASTIPLVPCNFVAGPGAGATATSITPPTEAGITIPTMTTY